MPEWDAFADAVCTHDPERERAAWRLLAAAHETEARRLGVLADQRLENGVDLADLAWAITYWHQSTEHALEAVRLTTNPPMTSGAAIGDEVTRPV